MFGSWLKASWSDAYENQLASREPAGCGRARPQCGSTSVERHPDDDVFYLGAVLYVGVRKRLLWKLIESVQQALRAVRDTCVSPARPTDLLPLL